MKLFLIPSISQKKKKKSEISDGLRGEKKIIINAGPGRKRGSLDQDNSDPLWGSTSYMHPILNLEHSVVAQSYRDLFCGCTAQPLVGQGSVVNTNTDFIFYFFK